MIDGILGIDVSKNTLDVSICSFTKVRTKRFANSFDGWRHLLDWLIAQKVQRVHACLESTGRYSLGIACALYEAGHTPETTPHSIPTNLATASRSGIHDNR